MCLPKEPSRAIAILHFFTRLFHHVSSPVDRRFWFPTILFPERAYHKDLLSGWSRNRHCPTPAPSCCVSYSHSPIKWLCPLVVHVVGSPLWIINLIVVISLHKTTQWYSTAWGTKQAHSRPDFPTLPPNPTLSTAHCVCALRRDHTCCLLSLTFCSF